MAIAFAVNFLTEEDAGADRRALDHQDELVGLLLFGNDRLQGGELLLQSVHLGLEFCAALLVHAQILNVGLERLHLCLGALKLRANVAERQAGNVEAHQNESHREPDVEQRLQRPGPISKTGSHD